MQAFEWTKLIVEEGVRPWSNPMGAPQFGAAFFMITGFHGTHVTFGVIFLIIIAIKVIKGDFDNERPGFMTRGARDAMKWWRRWACTGTSLTWCGYSSLHSSICGDAIGQSL